MDDYTAYVNPYFVVQKGRFTKHYFDGSARIVSKLGEGTFHHPNRRISAGGIDYIRQSAQMQEARDNYIRGLKVPPGPPTQHGIYASPEWTEQPYPSLGWQNIRQDQEPPEGWPRPPKFNEPGDVPGPPVQYGNPITPQTVKAGYGFIDNGIIEKNLYFYHPDHLGSSSYITDREGRITQHTEYIAFGEVLFEEHSTSKTMPYLFNGKELDQETGLYYYGARYYDPRVSLWLNVDPLAEKTMTPYVYTNNNPIMLIDPTGMESEDPIGSGYYTATTNSKTLGFFLRHPIAALSIGLPKKGSTNISTNSVRFSTRIGLEENIQKEGSQVNAYRHTLWQAEITKKIGSSVAKQIGNAHEENPFAVTRRNLKTTFSTLAKADETIDLLNNIIGRSIGETNPNANMKELALKTLDYFKEKGLWTATAITKDGKTIGWNIAQTKLNKEQYNNAKSIIQGLNENGFTQAEQQMRVEEAKKEIERLNRAPKW